MSHITDLPFLCKSQLHMHASPQSIARLRATCRLLSDFPMDYHMDALVAAQTARYGAPIHRTRLPDDLVHNHELFTARAVTAMISSQFWHPAAREWIVPRIVAARGWTALVRAMLKHPNFPHPGLVEHAWAVMKQAPLEEHLREAGEEDADLDPEPHPILPMAVQDVGDPLALSDTESRSSDGDDGDGGVSPLSQGSDEAAYAADADQQDRGDMYERAGYGMALVTLEALHYAVSAVPVDQPDAFALVNELLDHRGAVPETFHVSVLPAAMALGYTDIVLTLLDHPRALTSVYRAIELCAETVFVAAPTGDDLYSRLAARIPNPVPIIPWNRWMEAAIRSNNVALVPRLINEWQVCGMDGSPVTDPGLDVWLEDLALLCVRVKCTQALGAIFDHPAMPTASARLQEALQEY
ncbi:hypothetical protein BC828DRAFT_390063 [Blastocladiella britannica]|nr:hypothetical protein BC828DRAFT_390063 [Blastocladiella britannica]